MARSLGISPRIPTRTEKFSSGFTFPNHEKERNRGPIIGLRWHRHVRAYMAGRFREGVGKCSRGRSVVARVKFVISDTISYLVLSLQSEP